MRLNSMKVNLLIAILLSSLQCLHAQEPIKWTFQAIKIKASTYEVCMTANLQPGWHIYSQVQPADAIPLPTKAVIHPNPLIKLQGKVRETGVKQEHIDPSLGTTDNRYADKMELTQMVHVTGKVKTNVSGTITYQVCTDKKCLAPKTISFDMAIEK